VLGRAVADASLEAVDPLISPDELRAFRLVPDATLSRSEEAKIYRVMEAVADRWEQIRSAVPMQMIHADYYPSNVLADRRKLTGIIDFELSLIGPRVLDVAIGLWTFGAETGAYTWPAIDAFAGGYASILPLSDAEIGAIPDLIALREAGSLVHWSARYALGLIDQRGFAWRIERLHEVHAMMQETGPDLVERVHGIVQGTRIAAEHPAG
jgi:homoserine kinase type II